MWSMTAGQGLGTLLFPTPLPRFSLLEPCFQFCPLGTPTVFRLSLRSLRSLCLFVTSDSYTLKEYVPCLNFYL